MSCMRRIYRPFFSTWCRTRRPTTTTATTTRFLSTNTFLRYSTSATETSATATTTSATTTDDADIPTSNDDKELIQEVLKSEHHGVEITYTEEQLDIIRQQMKLNITKYKEDNMEVRLNKPQPDLTKRMGVTVQHTMGETKHSRLFRSHLDEDPTAESFQAVCEIYKDKYKTRQGHIDFIAAGLKMLTLYNLVGKHEAYEALVDVLPRGKFTPRTIWDKLMQAHPQLNLTLDVLTKMEENGLLPSQRMYDLCKEIFGKESVSLQKIARMWFWHGELSPRNPYTLPDETFLDRLDIILAAIARILSLNDYSRQTEPNVITRILEMSPPVQGKDMIDYNRFVVSGFTDSHRVYIESCRNVFIEGPHFMWVNHHPEQYFLMKGGKGEVVATLDNQLSEEEEREGAIVGVCFATKPYKETLMTWLNYMQEENPALRNANVVFDVSDMTDDTKFISESS